MKFRILALFDSFVIPLIFFVGCISFAACSESNDGDVAVIEIGKALDGGYEFASMSDCFSEIEYIPLQTDSSCYVGGRILNLSFVGDNILLADGDQRRCMLFGPDGKFIKFVGDLGNANGEYMAMVSYSANPVDGSIGVNDMQKVVVFDKDGNFIKNVDYTGFIRESGLFVPEIPMLGDYLVFCGSHYMTGMPYTFFVNENFDIVYADSLKSDNDGVEIAPSGLPKKYTPASYFHKEELYIVNPKSDTVWSYNSNLERCARYIFDYGKYKDGNKVNVSPRQVYEADDIIVFGVIASSIRFPFMPVKGASLCYIVYDKQSGNEKLLPYDETIEKYGFTNDMDGSGMSFLPKAAKGNVMYQLVDAYRFIESAERSTSDKMKEVAATLTEDSNPILVKAILK